MRGGADWLNAIDGWLGKLEHGPLHRFSFSRNSDFAGVDVEMMLRQYGIRVWGREVDNPDEIAFLVKRRQAVWAEYILCRAGVPLTCQLLDPRNTEYREQHPYGSMPTPWNEHGIGAHSLVDHVVDWIDALVGGKYSSKR